jgi:hypothetical protein
VNWSDLMAEWQGDPAAVPARPLRDLVLAALAEAVVTRRAGPVFCADCHPAALCADHREDLARARDYEAAYMRVMGIGSDGAMLEILGGLKL